MKTKVLSLCMAAALVLGSGTAAMAADTLGAGEAATREVKGTYNPAEDAGKVYKVDVTWGSMEFTYKAGDTHKVWNPKEHAYEERKDDGTWSSLEDANKVSITNFSNAAITAAITVEMDADSTGLTATPADTSLKLGDASTGASTTTPGKETTAFTTISLAGDLTDTEANSKVVGSVIVTFSDAEQQ